MGMSHAIMPEMAGIGTHTGATEACWHPWRCGVIGAQNGVYWASKQSMRKNTAKTLSAIFSHYWVTLGSLLLLFVILMHSVSTLVVRLDQKM